jgi:WD40 repeat protein
MESAQRRQHLSENKQLLAENKALKKKLEAAELSVRELKLSVYDLSARLSAALARNGNGGGGNGHGNGGHGGNGNGGEDNLSNSLVDLSDGRTPASVVASVSDAYHPHGENGEGSSSTKPQDGRHLSPMCTLTGHAGAVYATSFSPDGRLLASGSFDKTVRCWAMDEVEPGETLCLQKHSHNVSSLCWSGDSRSLLSGSYDHTIRLWDVEAAACARTWLAPEAAFVQCVAYHPTSPTLFAAATTASSLVLFDARTSGERPVCELPNGVMVNSVTFLPRGEHVLTGDKHGALRTWDLRQRQCVAGAYAGDARKPVSHVCLSAPLPTAASARGGGVATSGGMVGGGMVGGGVGGGFGGVVGGGFAGLGVGVLLDRTAEPRLLAVNSYDDTLRVYNRGYAPPGALMPPPEDGASPLDPQTPRHGSPVRPESVHSSNSSHGASPSPQGHHAAGGGGRAAAAEGGDGATGGGGGDGGGGNPVARESSNSSAEGSGDKGSSAAGGGGADDGEEGDEGQPAYYSECAHALVGHRNRSYPIRSAMYVGAEYTGVHRGGVRRSAVVDTYGGADDARRDPHSMTVHSTVLLATGSADGDTYLYDVGGPSGTGELVQKLRGHTDRVYAVDFHPHEPILASVSADFSVRLWAPPRRRGKRGGERGRGGGDS